MTSFLRSMALQMVTMVGCLLLESGWQHRAGLLLVVWPVLATTQAIYDEVLR